MSEWENMNPMPGMIGFCYKITCKTTGKFYIGKKMLIANKRRKPLKGRKNGRKYQTESNYKTYYGSCNKLLTDIERLGKDNFRREVLRFCSNKFDLAYYELKYQLEYDVLNNPMAYNEILNVRLRKRK